MASAPLSVVLSDDLRSRLAVEARKRGLKLSTVVRELVTERVREIDESSEMSAADHWQRARAWSSWEKLRAGDRAEASADEVAADFERAIVNAKRRRR